MRLHHCRMAIRNLGFQGCTRRKDAETRATWRLGGACPAFLRVAALWRSTNRRSERQPCANGPRHYGAPAPQRDHGAAELSQGEESPEPRKRHMPPGRSAVHPLPHHLCQLQVPGASHEAGAPGRLRGPEVAGDPLYLLHLCPLFPILQGPHCPPAWPRPGYQALPTSCTHHRPARLPLS